MNRIIASLLLFCAMFLVALQPASAVTIDWNLVGNPGNAADTTGYGFVAYNYRIGKYDVTSGQYAEFLNTKDQTGANTLGLWNSGMANGVSGGINFNAGNPNGSKYTLVSGNGNHPLNFVTWYDTVRFANWLNNGQGSGDTESGAYTLLGGTATPSNGLSITRNPGATVFLPSEDEWYKAAYSIPGTSSYYQYPTSSNTEPTGSSPTGLANHANIATGGPFNLTDVGAYTGTTSPYGAFDMGGNVFQWNEALISGSFRGVRGGSFDSIPPGLLSSARISGVVPTLESAFIGIRVASLVPEPSTGVLAVIACGLILWWRKRFK